MHNVISKGILRNRSWMLAAALASLLMVGCGGGGGGGTGDTGGGTVNLPPPTNVPALQAQAGVFFPSSAGNAWEYDVVDSSSAQGSGRETMRYLGTETVGGEVAHVLETTEPDGFVSKNRYQVRTDGVYYIPGPGDDDVALSIGVYPMLRSPVVAGDRWTAIDKEVGLVLDLDGDGRLDPTHFRVDVTVVGQEQLTLRNGQTVIAVKFNNAATFKSAQPTGGRAIEVKLTIDEWYVAGIGLVRQLVDGGAAIQVDTQLVSWQVTGP